MFSYSVIKIYLVIYYHHRQQEQEQQQQQQQNNLLKNLEKVVRWRSG